MLKWKKIIALCLALLLAVTGSAFPFEQEQTVFAEDAVTDAGKADRYFYDQLKPDAKVFYDAMRQMYKNGTFKTGRESLELTGENGFLSQSQVAAYMAGQSDLLAVFGAARDAFYMDYPEIFYVDFSLLSIRVTQAEDVYHVYIGSGRQDNYYTAGFTSVEDVNEAVNEFEKAADDVAKQAKALTAEEDENLTAKQIEFVHDYITNHTSYRLENVCKTENISLIRTAYGSLVRGEAVCEGYARAFKAILDRLEIPCVLVEGVYRHTEEIVELHMWNYVQIDGKWYGVDTTMDDPYNTATDTTGVDGYENQVYLLTGDSIMSTRHAPNGILSTANYEFVYPELELDSFGIETTHYANGLTVKYKKDGEFEDIPAGEYWVSFQGMGYAKAAEQGYYMLSRFNSIDRNTDEWTVSDWAYITPEIYSNAGIQDSDTELHMYMPHVEYVEFGVTDIAPGDYYENLDNLYYQGDPSLLLATTGMLHNPSGTYKAPPYPVKSSPSPQGRLDIAKGKYHFEILFDDDLILMEDEDFDVAIECSQYVGRVLQRNKSGETNSKIENVALLDDGRTISFDFTPSPMWSDDMVLYKFSFKGIVGEYSGKAPIDLTYVAAHKSSFCALGVSGYNWSLFGKPALLENGDLSMSDWKTSDGEPIADELQSRLALVVTSPSHAQTDTMNEMIEDTGETILKSETYNINLTVCKCQVIQTGQSVRLSLGFPEGYGPNDAGVTFKAYHFMKNDAGDVIGVEEIPCIITPYGLLVLCDSFSPFAIVAVESDDSAADMQKHVILSDSLDGSVTVSEKPSLFTIEDEESLTVNIQANDGYVIDTLSVPCDYEILDGGIGQEKMTISLSTEELAVGSNIIDAQFVVKEIKEAEEAKGEVVVVPEAVAAEVSISEERIVMGNEPFIIEPSVTEGDYLYQWYKDGVALIGQTDRDLYITAKDVNKGLLGEYTLEVTTIAGTSIAHSTSNVCAVNKFILVGDADDDGMVTTDDAFAILAYVVGMDQVVIKKEAGDCDGKAGISTDDAFAILEYVVGARNKLIFIG